MRIPGQCLRKDIGKGCAQVAKQDERQENPQRGMLKTLFVHAHFSSASLTLARNQSAEAPSRMR